MIANRKSLVQSLAAGLAFLSAAHAGVIFNNISSSETIGNGSVAPSGAYQSFSNLSPGFSLTDVKVLLQGSVDTGSLSVDLYADSSTSPGSPIDHIGTLSDAFLPGNGTAVFDFPVSPFALSVTRYWIGLTGSSDAGWELEGPFQGHPSDVGVTGEFVKLNGTVFSDFDQAFQMTVTVSATSTPPSVPEPSTFLLGGLGLLALVVLNQQRR